VIVPPAGSRIWLASGITDMRKGLPGLSALVTSKMDGDPYAGDIFLFRGRQGDQIKVLWCSGDGMNLYIKRLERGRFVWPSGNTGRVLLSAAQFAMLLEAIDWRAPERTWWPTITAR